MSGILEGRVAVVTGGARGIGLAVAQTLVMQGARVLIVDNGAALDGSTEDSVVAEAAVTRCEALAAGSARALGEDVSAPGAAARIVEAAREHFGALDILVNNAAIECGAPIDGMLEPEAARVLATNLAAPLALLAAATPLMREQAVRGRIPGAIVNMICTSGLYGRPGHAAETAAKAGLLGLTRATALDLRPARITCNAVAPFAATRANTRPAQSAPVDERTRRRQAQSAGVPASHVANLVAWLASSQAATVSGQVFGVRGRELMLFSQPRPVRTVFTDGGTLDADALAQAVLARLSPDFTPLLDDLDVFDGDPVI